MIKELVLHWLGLQNIQREVDDSDEAYESLYKSMQADIEYVLRVNKAQLKVNDAQMDSNNSQVAINDIVQESLDETRKALLIEAATIAAIHKDLEHLKERLDEFLHWPKEQDENGDFIQ